MIALLSHLLLYICIGLSLLHTYYFGELLFATSGAAGTRPLCELFGAPAVHLDFPPHAAAPAFPACRQLYQMLDVTTTIRCFRHSETESRPFYICLEVDKPVLQLDLGGLVRA